MSKRCAVRISFAEILAIIIQPIHNRVPLADIRNKSNWEKGYDEGYPSWEKGDNLRKEGAEKKKLEKEQIKNNF